MAESTDLKHMIMSFRVSELQVLLGFAGRSKSGRKQELLQRALCLVQRGCSVPVQIKIRELYRRRFPGRASSPTQRISSPPSTDPSGVNCKPNMCSADSRESLQERRIQKPNVKLLTKSGPIDFSNKHNLNHSSSSSALPVHPDVQLRRLPFYDIMGELLKPTSLVPKPNSRFQETFFIFHLTPQQAQDIAMSRDFRPGAKCEYTTQVQLRFCLLETSCEQEDNFPPSICVRVNGKMAPLPNPIPTTKPGIEPKRPGRPVDITSLCRLSPTVPNHVDVSWASEFGRGYCVAVYLVKKLTSDILLQRLKQFGNRHPDHSRALIKEKLQHDPDSEIATTSLRVSLMCPLGKMRILIPCRASTCTHLQCFDASTFLMMNEKKPTWVCPVCDKSAHFAKLIIDGLFVEILQQAANCTEIQFGEDGSWSPMKAFRETLVISSPVIKSSPSATPVKKPQVEVIDLTMDSSTESEDDDDDDDNDDESIPRASSTQTSTSGSVSSAVSPTPIPSVMSSSLFSMPLPPPSHPVITASYSSSSCGQPSMSKDQTSFYTPSVSPYSEPHQSVGQLPVFRGPVSINPSNSPDPLFSLLQTDNTDDVEISDLIGLPSFPTSSSTLVGQVSSPSGLNPGLGHTSPPDVISLD